MRVAIVSDVHSNLPALEAVLAHAEQQRSLDQVWALGDMVGYGPQPAEVLRRLRECDLRAVCGNHDYAAIGAIDTREFNPTAAAANRWNADRLSDADRDFIRGLPLTLAMSGLSLAHGSLRDPIWEYMITHAAALAQFGRMTTPHSLVGHTHVQLIFAENPGDEMLPDYWQPEDGELVKLGERRLILNPGSVGQPRDGDPRAGYCIYDDEADTITFHRVPYDIARTQALIREAGLPASLGRRLSLGR